MRSMDHVVACSQRLGDLYLLVHPRATASERSRHYDDYLNAYTERFSGSADPHAPSRHGSIDAGDRRQNGGDVVNFSFGGLKFDSWPRSGRNTNSGDTSARLI